MKNAQNVVARSASLMVDLENSLPALAIQNANTLSKKLPALNARKIKGTLFAEYGVVANSGDVATIQNVSLQSLMRLKKRNAQNANYHS